MSENSETDDDRVIDEHTGVEINAHEWDGIQELDTPMPRWWIGIMYITIVWAIGYVILMPAIPLVNSYTKGLLNFSDRARVDIAVEKMHAERSVRSKELATASISQIVADDGLYEFAIQQGSALFGDNCETCHGRRGQGVIGYPNLNDNAWIWGGSFEDIKYSITYGIRSEHDDTRFSSMMAYGTDEILEPAQISDVVQFVLKISGQQSNAESALRGTVLFEENCSSCHGVDGKGDYEQGAPNLTDTAWIYGGNSEAIYKSIFNGRDGVMPHWNERLSADQITALTVYVHSDLGGGE